MKRLPLILSFTAFILLCMSLSFWGLRVFKPQARSVAAPALQSSFEPGVGQWGNLFGNSQAEQNVASNYQLKGVIVAKRMQDSEAIISANGKPAQSVRLNQELAPGVTLREVHDQYILISEGGAVRRVDLPQAAQINRVSLQESNPAPAAAFPQPQPAAFPLHNRNPVSPMAPAVPVVTPGMPVASLPATMPEGVQ